MKLILPLIALLLFACDGTSQNKPKTYEPTREQHLELEVLQKDAQLSAVDMRAAVAAFNAKLAALRAKGEDVRKENKWPADIKMNDDSLVFATATPAPTEKEQPKK